MLTRTVENHVDKCAQYWPEEVGFMEDFGDFDILLEAENEDSFCIRREIKITKLTTGKTRSGKWQKIRFTRNVCPRI